MNFIVCGASRAGKSTLSKRLMKEFDATWLVGDCLVEALEKAFPHIGVKFHGNIIEVGNIFTDYLIELLRSYQDENVPFVLDTVHIRPNNVKKIHDSLGHLPSVFLGYININENDKVKLIRYHDPKDTDFWSVKMSDNDLIMHTKGHIQLSKNDEIECKKFNIPFFDTGMDFIKVQECAYQSLVKQSGC